MERWVRKVAMVTGASSGIGEAIAESLVKHGMIVVGLARREEKLKEIEKKLQGQRGNFYPMKTDLLKEEDILNAFKWTEDKFGAIHVFVNNAGILTLKKLEEQKSIEWRQLYNTNILALQICSVEAIKSMKKNKVADGHIINISSVMASTSPPYPETIPYFASKRAASAISDGLRVELAAERSDIRVTTICPGLVDTEIFNSFREKMPEEVLKLGLKPSDVADTVIFALQLPPNVLITELTVQPVRDIIVEAKHMNKSK